jgi:hypothetical protein
MKRLPLCVRKYANTVSALLDFASDPFKMPFTKVWVFFKSKSLQKSAKIQGIESRQHCIGEIRRDGFCLEDFNMEEVLLRTCTGRQGGPQRPTAIKN